MTSTNSTMDDEVVCPLCGGEGKYEVEVEVIDHMRGGYLDSEVVDCEMCGGWGKVDKEEAAEFVIHVELEDGNYYH